MIYATAVHLEGGSQHEHITKIRWRDPAAASSTVATMVDWIDGGNDARVEGAAGYPDVQIGVVRPNRGPAFIRTHADGQWADNLLALPKY